MIFYRLGKLATRYRWWVIGVWLLAVLLALPFAPRAGQVLKAGGLSSPDAESQRAIDVLTHKLHLSQTIVQVIFTSQRYRVDDPQFIAQTQQALAELRTWKSVATITTFLDNPRQVAPDGHAAYVNVQLNAAIDNAPQLLPELERRLQRVPDLQWSIGGGPVFYQDIQVVSENDLRRAELLAFPFAIIALLLVFRSVVAAILPSLVGGFAVVVALALVFALGHITDLSIFVLNITTLFGLGLGVDYSLFLVSRFREEVQRGHPIDDAVVLTVATAGRAVAFSGLAVTIGLFGLTFFHINMLHSVGLGGILVVSLAVTAALTLLPALLSVLGLRVNALPVRFPRLRRQRRAVAMHDGTLADEIAAQHGYWYRLSQFVMRYPLRVFFPVLLLLLGFGLPFLSVRFSAPDASILPDYVPSRTAYNLLAAHFDQRETTPILIAVQTHGNVLTADNIDNLYAYVQRIEADPRVARVDSIVSADPHFTLEQYQLLYTHPELITDPYIGALLKSTVADNTLLVQVISKYAMVDPRSQALVQTIRNTSAGHGITILVDGATAGNIDYVHSLYTDFPIAILVIAITTYLVLFLLFRSVLLPLKAIVMNTLSILASYGALVIIFQDGFLHQLLGFQPLGFVEASSPILLFCALFGLSMDYEVFLLSRIQEAYWLIGDNTQAVALGLQRSGSIITNAAVIVIVVSACFATADMILVKALGLGMALAVLIDATLVRGLLVPATMRLLGKWNWWVPFVGIPRRPPTSLPYLREYEGMPADLPEGDAQIGGKR
jgi:Predicted drug exporters of the RND superfamily